MLQQSSPDGLGKALYFKERAPVLRTALSAHNDRVLGDLCLIEEFLHQKLVIDVIVRKLVDTEQIETTVVFDACFHLAGILRFQTHQLPAQKRIHNPSGTNSFLAGPCGDCFSHPGFPGLWSSPDDQVLPLMDEIEIAKVMNILQIELPDTVCKKIPDKYRIPEL